MCYAPDGDGMYTRSSSQSLFLWGQSVFIIAQLLTAGLLHINELDPIRRYLPSYNRPRKGGRYSAFQVSKGASPRKVLYSWVENLNHTHTHTKTFSRDKWQGLGEMFYKH